VSLADAKPLVPPQQFNASVLWTHYYTDHSSETEKMYYWIDVPNQRSAIKEGVQWETAWTMYLEFPKLNASYSYNAYKQCDKKGQEQPVTFINNPDQYTYMGAVVTDGCDADYWVQNPKFPNWNAWIPLNATACGWKLKRFLGDPSDPNQYYGKWQFFNLKEGPQPDDAFEIPDFCNPK
jgi:hypothetical protein